MPERSQGGHPWQTQEPPTRRSNRRRASGSWLWISRPWSLNRCRLQEHASAGGRFFPAWAPPACWPAPRRWPRPPPPLSPPRRKPQTPRNRQRHAAHQRQGLRAARARHACHPARHAARAHSPHRHQEGLRPRPVRRLHGARERSPREQLPLVRRDARGRRDHHHRRHRPARKSARDAGGLCASTTATSAATAPAARS